MFPTENKWKNIYQIANVCSGEMRFGLNVFSEAHEANAVRPTIERTFHSPNWMHKQKQFQENRNFVPKINTQGNATGTNRTPSTSVRFGCIGWRAGARASCVFSHEPPSPKRLISLEMFIRPGARPTWNASLCAEWKENSCVFVYWTRPTVGNGAVIKTRNDQWRHRNGQSFRLGQSGLCANGQHAKWQKYCIRHLLSWTDDNCQAQDLGSISKWKIDSVQIQVTNEPSPN